MSISNGTVLRLVAGLLYPDNVVAQMVFHLVATDLAGGNDEEDVVADLREYAEDALVNLDNRLLATITEDEVVVYEYDSVDEDFDEIGRDQWTVTLTGTGELLPHGVAAVVNFNTTDPDVQGRKYVPGLVHGAMESTLWGSNVIADLALFGTAVSSPFTSTALGNEYQPAVWSPTNLNAFAMTGVGTVSGIPGYQRRRKPGVGI